MAADQVLLVFVLRTKTFRTVKLKLCWSDPTGRAQSRAFINLIISFTPIHPLSASLISSSLTLARTLLRAFGEYWGGMTVTALALPSLWWLTATVRATDWFWHPLQRDVCFTLPLTLWARVWRSWSLHTHTHTLVTKHALYFLFWYPVTKLSELILYITPSTRRVLRPLGVARVVRQVDVVLDLCTHQIQFVVSTLSKKMTSPKSVFFILFHPHIARYWRYLTWQVIPALPHLCVSKQPRADAALSREGRRAWKNN